MGLVLCRYEHGSSDLDVLNQTECQTIDIVTFRSGLRQVKNRQGKKRTRRFAGSPSEASVSLGRYDRTLYRLRYARLNIPAAIRTGIRSVCNRSGSIEQMHRSASLRSRYRYGGNPDKPEPESRPQCDLEIRGPWSKSDQSDTLSPRRPLNLWKMIS